MQAWVRRPVVDLEWDAGALQGRQVRAAGLELRRMAPLVDDDVLHPRGDQLQLRARVPGRGREDDFVIAGQRRSVGETLEACGPCIVPSITAA